MELHELIKDLTPAQIDGPLDREISAIEHDSHCVTPGALFVALPGERTDGHRFISAAIERGARALVVSQNSTAYRALPNRPTRIRVTDTRAALADLAARFYGRPGNQLNLVGVTGTNGKTTVSFMTRQILNGTGIRTGLLGTVRYEIGDRSIPASRTTPQAVELQSLLAQMVKTRCGACVLEVSSHALDQQRVRGLEFDTAVFTNLTQDHLDYHQTMDQYFAAKLRLFQTLGQGSKPANAVINLDDPRSAEIIRTLSPKVHSLSYGIQAKADIVATDIHALTRGTRFVVETPVGRARIQLPVIGLHNVSNALAALGVGIGMGIPLEAMATSLLQLHCVPGRLEAIEAGQPFRVFVDYAHTDDALRHALTTLRALQPKRLIVVFGCGGSRDTQKRPLMGRAASELSDFAVLTSDNPRKEKPAAILRQIESGFREAHQYKILEDRQQAIEYALHLAQEGDIILIAGKGHETVQEYADTIVPFDDREVVREILTAPAALVAGKAAWKL
jgi:UDP-N-acetylmuramoyl-L-alanyl-D-glutamate--2,6-diaminopimelate ligase